MSNIENDCSGLLKKNIETFTTWDDNLLRREYGNGYMDDKTGRWKENPYTVRFTRIRQHDAYVIKSGKNPGPDYFRLLPGKFVILPHAFYLIEGEGLPIGEPIKLTMNLETKMGIENKIPSNRYGING